MGWVLTRGLQRVRAEFNDAFARRDKTTDGSVGNLAHQVSTSGHNPDRTGRAEYKDGDNLDEVRAIDVDADLVPGSDIDYMELVIQFLVKKARNGGYIPFRYIIYKGRIWARSDGWKTRTYTGANKHTQHAHFSGDYTSKADNWSGTLGIASVLGAGGGGEEDVAVITPEDRTEIAKEVVTRLLSTDLGSPGGGDTVGVALQTGAFQNTRSILTLVNGIATAVAGLDQVDEQALASALAPAVATLVTPALVAAVEANGGAPLTETQVTDAVKAALREGTA